MASINVRDVAARAGVSVGTVSNVLNRPERVSAETVERVHAVIAELGFVRNDAARQLRAGNSRAVGLVVLDISNPFFSDLARGAQQAADENGSVILLGNSDQDAKREGSYLDLFEEQRVRGVLISPVGDVEARLARLRQRGIAAVLVDHRIPGSGFSSVSVDDVAGGKLAVEHLLALGRRRIAFVGGPSTLHQFIDRLEGARGAVAGTPGATLEVIRTESLTILEGRAAGENIVARAPGDRPDAIFAANDLVALGLVQSFAMTNGLRIPEEIAIVGYDDIDFAASAVVPLTSVSQPSELIGRTAIELVISELDDATQAGKDIVFQPELVIRASTNAQSHATEPKN
ncbi:MAG: LacI family DNA-binding transcriptional regulator [Microbacteriaceae bacterium]